MTTALPAMRAQFGSTEYFLVTMRAKDLADRLVIPKEMDEWEDMTIEERFQREVNYSRVKKHIAPYLANDPDRFLGAFVVDIFNPEEVEFEPIGEIVKKLPTLYQKAGDSFGYLYFQGNEVLIPLDGQHRLAAIRFAISGRDEKGKEIDGLDPNMDVANDLCTVILVKHDSQKARKIFNKINRYAKATTKAENLITSDDDIVAIITREEVADNIIGERLVNYQSNALSAKAKEFTTLSTIYDATTLVLTENFGKIETTVLPTQVNQNLYRSTSSQFWQTLCNELEIFKLALHEPSEDGDEKRREIRKDYTLGKPIVQLAVVDAAIRLSVEYEDGERLALKDVCGRLNELDWGVGNSLWQRVLMNGDRVVTGRQAAKFAGRFIAYLLGEPLETTEVDVLTAQYNGLFGEDEKPGKLPERLYG